MTLFQNYLILWFLMINARRRNLHRLAALCLNWKIQSHPARRRKKLRIHNSLAQDKPMRNKILRLLKREH